MNQKGHQKQMIFQNHILLCTVCATPQNWKLSTPTCVALSGEHLLLIVLVLLGVLLLPPPLSPGPRAHVGHPDPGLGVDTQPGPPLTRLPTWSLLFTPEILCQINFHSAVTFILPKEILIFLTWTDDWGVTVIIILGRHDWLDFKLIISFYKVDIWKNNN